MKPSGKVKGLIFDFNGVLLWDDWIQRVSWRTFASQFRERILSDEEIDKYVHGRNGQDTLKYLLGEKISSEKASMLLEQKETIYRQMCLEMDGEFQLSLGAIELLNNLIKYKIPHTIATASGIKNVNFFADHLKLERWFEIEKIVYDNGRLKGKPAPDLYLEAAKNLNLPPEACVVIEDSHSGIKAAHAANVGWLVALGPVEKHATLSNLSGVNQVITDLGQIVWQDLFEQMAG